MDFLDPQLMVYFLAGYGIFILAVCYAVIFGGNDCHDGGTLVSFLVFRASHAHAVPLTSSIRLLTVVTAASAMRCDTGPIGNVHWFLTGGICDVLQRSSLSRMCGIERTSNALALAGVWCEKYAMPAAYVGLLAAGLTCTSRVVITRLPDLEVFDSPDALCPRSRFLCFAGGYSLPPRTPPVALSVYAVLAFSSWLAVLLSNPGTVTTRSLAKLATLFPYDGMLFNPGKDCFSCHTPRLARSKHCNICKRCVARFDHHCGWVGTCVGLYNTRNFIAFLTVHFVMLVHGTILCAEVIRARMQHLIAGNFVYTPTNTHITSFSFGIAFMAETNVCLFLFVLVLSSAMVGGFLLYHWSLVFRNVTTNETYKWETLLAACKEFASGNGGKPIGQVMTEEAEAQRASAPTCTDGSAVTSARIPLFDAKGLPANIYNRGIVQNVLEVALPHRFVLSKADAEIGAHDRTAPSVPSTSKSD